MVARWIRMTLTLRHGVDRLSHSTPHAFRTNRSRRSGLRLSCSPGQGPRALDGSGADGYRSIRQAGSSLSDKFQGRCKRDVLVRGDEVVMMIFQHNARSLDQMTGSRRTKANQRWGLGLFVCEILYCFLRIIIFFG